jgi:hypothetical protein
MKELARTAMKPGQIRSGILVCMVRNMTAILCALLTLPGNAGLWAMQQQPSQPAQQKVQSQQQPTGSSTPAAKISNEQLDSLVAPIALYPDPLLGQMLVASTYPLEIVQLHQWLEQNKKLKDKALADAVMKKGWDPSVQAMAVFPDVVKQMATNIAWTDDLGNAFLAQQNDVMDAVQRMRSKAVEKGALKTTEQQTVETKVVEQKTVVVVQPAKTEVVYVPSYDPVAIWGSPYYPYPAYAYPAYPAGGMLLGFGVGLAVGAAWGGGWGWNTGWGGNNVYVNRNNTFVNNYSRVNGGRYGGANGQWQHNAAHRGGAPYANQSVANRYNGSARGSTMSQRQTAARQNTGNFGASQFRSGNSTAGTGAQNLNRSAAGGGGDRIGNRQVSSQGSSARSNSAFSGGSSGSAARASSARGTSSMGGGMRGGGMRGGGRRR